MGISRKKTLQTVASLAALGGALVVLLGDSAPLYCHTFEDVEKRYEYVLECGESSVSGSFHLVTGGGQSPQYDGPHNATVTVESGQLDVTAEAVFRCPGAGGHATLSQLNLLIGYPELSEGADREGADDVEAEEPVELAAPSQTAPTNEVIPCFGTFDGDGQHWECVLVRRWAGCDMRVQPLQGS